MNAKLDGFDVMVTGGDSAVCYAAETMTEREIRTHITFQTSQILQNKSDSDQRISCQYLTC